MDEFKGAWRALGTLAPECLKALRHVATVESIGSSTRIAGSKLSDREVERLLSRLEIKKSDSRDEQEVAGTGHVLEIVGYVAETTGHVGPKYPAWASRSGLRIPVDITTVRLNFLMRQNYTSSEGSPLPKAAKFSNFHFKSETPRISLGAASINTFSVCVIDLTGHY